MSLLFAHWDFRALWAQFNLIAQGFLTFLFVFTIFNLKLAINATLTSRRGSLRDPNTIPLLPKLRVRAANLRELFFVSILFFGLCLCNEVFGGLRAVLLSGASLNAYPIEEALAVPTAFAFVVFTIFIVLEALQWWTAAKLRLEPTTPNKQTPR
jgi:hypothetical protein